MIFIIFKRKFYILKNKNIKFHSNVLNLKNISNFNLPLKISFSRLNIKKNHLNFRLIQIHQQSFVDISNKSIHPESLQPEKKTNQTPNKAQNSCEITRPNTHPDPQNVSQIWTCTYAPTPEKAALLTQGGS